MIYINGRRWRVFFDSSVTDDDANCKGITSFEKGIIAIKPGMDTDYTLATLIHELTHAFLDSYGFSYNDTFTHEQLCEWTSSYIKPLAEVYEKAVDELHRQQCRELHKVSRKQNSKPSKRTRQVKGNTKIESCSNCRTFRGTK